MKKLTKIILIALTLALLLAVPFAVYASDDEPSLKIEAANLSFMDSISILYAVSGENVDMSEVKLLIWTAPKSGIDEYVKGSEAHVLDSERYDSIDSVSCKVFDFDKLGAHQMTDEFYARAYVEVGDKVYYSNLSKYSIIRYAHNKLGYTGTATENEILISTLESMLEYGATVQLFADYKTDRLPTDRYYKISVEGGVLEDGTTSGLYRENESVSVKSYDGTKSHNIEVKAQNVIADAETGDTKIGFHTCVPAATVKENEIPATCKTEGSYDEVIYCSLCEAELSRESKTTDKSSEHTPATAVKENEIPATCKTEGSYDEVVYCSVCDKELSRNGKTTGKSGHNYIDHVCEYCNESDYNESFTFELLSNDTYKITGYTGDATEIVIPSTYNGKPVTVLAAYLFQSRTNITSVTIPNSIRSIGNGVFRYCSGITSITIPFVGANYDGTGSTNFGYLFGTSSASSNSSYVPASLKTVIITGGEKIAASAFSNCQNITKITLPDSLKTIEASAFRSCSSLETITIPDSVTSLGKYVFYSCSAMKTAFIGNGVETVPEQAFYGCAALVEISFGANVKAIDMNAFHACKLLADMYYGGSIADWCNITFANNAANPLNYANNLYVGGERIKGELIIPNTVTEIKRYAFYNFTSITAITIPSSVTKIGTSAFNGCSSLESITLPFVGEKQDGTGNTNFGYIFGASTSSNNSSYVPESLKKVTVTGGSKIGSAAFKNCINITDISLPNSITSIGANAFSSCKSLEILIIPDSVTSLGDYVSSSCTALRSVVIGNGVETIPANAFDGCKALIEIMIGSNVKTIKSNAFRYCDALTDVCYLGTLADWCSISFASASCNPMYYAENFYLGSRLLEGDVVIPNTVTEIKPYTFYNFTSLTGITIPTSVTKIGTQAFAGCTALERMSIPFVGETPDAGYNKNYFGYIFGASSYSNNKNSVPSSLKTVTVTGGSAIPSSAFYDCANITSITLPETATFIGSSAFTNCSGLTELVIPDSVQVLEAQMFSGCASLKTLTVGSGITTIGYNILAGCDSLEDVYYRGTIDQWCAISFAAGHSSFTYYDVNIYIDGKLVAGEIVIPSTTERIKEHAFYGCKSITSVIIEDGVGLIEAFAFSRCEALESVIIGDGVTTIEQDAFSHCTSLKSVKIGESVTSIEFSTFNGCVSLESIVIPDSVEYIDQQAFHNCTGLKSVTIGKGLTSIGYTVFSGCNSIESMTVPFIGDNKENPDDTHLGYFFGAPNYSQNADSVPASLKTVIITGDTFIGKRTFYGCSNIEDIIIGEEVTGIGDSAFFGCIGITDIVIPDSVEHLDYGAFKGCASLKNVVIGNGVTVIGQDAFSNCESLESVTFNGEVKTIDYYAFSYCTSLTNITLPDSVEIINGCAFYGCSGLVSITIPEGVTSIGFYTFYDCSNLTNINFCGTEEQWIAMSKDPDWDFGTGEYTITYNYVPER